MYGKGYIYGLGAAFILWLVISQIDKRYYKKKLELLRKQLGKREEQAKKPVEDGLSKTEDTSK
ncbi:hypothetical protein [Simiduia aestuariiviva]|uniref:Uncharacterized protein n=1 Tax=Simiduia aestuariiviva TaxID=1510459 RepID=A0A839UJP0_9GAMM|nr:hypothetical protein [Simiduia aestuariiviva]MBB3166829.1 hypothetical protein [Simiduia aestuariiviva]